jgi:hypothetical protein
VVEYGALLGLNVKSFFTSTPISEMFLPVGLGIPLIAAGYLLKGVWGAGVAFLIGTVLLLYCKGLPPFGL